MSNYATKKEIEHTTGIDTSAFAAKKDVIALKSEVAKLDINKLANVPISLNKLKTKVHDLTVPVNLKKLSNVVDNEAVKNKIQYAKDKIK